MSILDLQLEINISSMVSNLIAAESFKVLNSVAALVMLDGVTIQTRFTNPTNGASTVLLPGTDDRGSRELFKP
jgi:hypothetical protein